MIKKRPKIWPWMLRKEIIILYYALKDKRTSLTAKLPALLSLAYLFSPLDIIPDFIPFVGYIDDVLVVPFLLSLSIRLLPSVVREESILKAERNKRKFKLLIFLCFLLIICWLVGIFFLLRYFINNH